VLDDAGGSVTVGMWLPAGLGPVNDIFPGVTPFSESIRLARGGDGNRISRKNISGEEENFRVHCVFFEHLCDVVGHSRTCCILLANLGVEPVSSIAG
jgi:hypothetical protein